MTTNDLTEPAPALFDLDDVTPPWEPIYRNPPAGIFENRSRWAAWAATHPSRCRDCGDLMTRLPWTHGCSGARPDLGLFDLCDDCATLDFVPDTDRSRWGISATARELHHLRELQAKRRAAHRRTHHLTTGDNK